MKLSVILCFTINLCISEDISGVSSEEGPDYLLRVETPLDFRGKIRQLFALEIGLQAKGGNMICSPISAMMPLAKLVLGATNKSRTEKELLSALGLKNKQELKGEYMQALKELHSLKGVEISIASRIYVSRKKKLQSKFKRNSQSIFGSAIELVDTGHPEEVANTVNKWVAEHTKNKITNLISPNDIDPGLSLILVNAIYFKGYWRTPFRPAILQSFYSPAGIISVPMMHISGSFNYIQSDDLNAQIIELPYEGGEVAMIIILPNAKNGLPILLRALKVSHDLLNDALMNMKTAVVDVTIPKFKIETTMDLKSYYKKMGVRHCLAPELSDLNQVVKGEKVHISSATQAAIIEVTEQGTEASAASAIQIVPLAAIRAVQFTANYPFLFYIDGQHDQLFAGIVNSP